MPAPPPQVDPTAAAAPPGAPPPAPLRPDRSAPGPPSQVLVDLARGGDSYAFEELVRAHQHQAYAVALRMTGDHHNAQDAVQDDFLRAWQHLDRFRGDADFSTWLTRIVLNACHAQHRASRPTDPLPEDTTHSSSPAAETRAVTRAQAAAAQEAILALPFDQRAALVLHVFVGYSHAQVAEVLQISDGAAKVRVHRARQALLDRLKEWR